MAQFLHIFVRFNDGQTHHDTIKPVIELAIDWYRYSSTNWIVWTTSDAQKWYERLRKHISDDDSIFIVALDIHERQGWMTTDFWEWIRKNRD